MNESQNLIMRLLRLITPEEISEIATKHNGGKFLSLKDLAYERFEKKVYRDFSDRGEENLEKKVEVTEEAKILPFNTDNKNEEKQLKQIAHSDNENMATFILIEKERLKKSQKSLKQKEIIDLYKKNLNVDVEQIKNSNHEPSNTDDVGILVNKKHF